MRDVFYKDPVPLSTKAGWLTILEILVEVMISLLV